MSEAQKNATKKWRQKRAAQGTVMIGIMLDAHSLDIIKRLGGGKTTAIKQALRIDEKSLLNEGLQNELAQ